VTKVKRKQGYKRGYPVALLVGFENANAVLWHVFSHVVKLHLTLELGGKRTSIRNALINDTRKKESKLKSTKEGDEWFFWED
jgi:hypothetical protein